MFGLLNIMNSFNQNSFNQNSINIDINMNELDDRYVIVGHLMGVARNNININYENDHIIITVRVNRTSNRSGYGGMVFFQQVSSVRKAFYVPNIDYKRITGNFERGNLLISIPKNIISINDKVIIDVNEYEEEKRLE